MKQTISHELLSLITELPVTAIKEVHNNFFGGLTAIQVDYMDTESFGTIYIIPDTLGRLCKEWLLKETRLKIMSGLDEHNSWVCKLGTNTYHNTRQIVKYGDTELEAIIKITEHIIKSKD